MSLKGQAKQRRRQQRHARAERTKPAQPGRSPQAAQGAWRWPEARADKLQLLRDHDSLSEFRAQLSFLGKLKDEWAGLPMPLADSTLVIEPKYPNAERLMEIQRLFKPAEKVEPDDPGVKFRNRFWVTRYRMYVDVYEIDGRCYRIWHSGQARATMELETLGASVAWGIEQESAALQLLATLLPHHAFKKYLLTGMFLESSKRSGLTYLFRKLRPTLVLDTKGAQGVRTLCALCLHPIAYYAGSWAGAMCPTDDVIAHLMLMRGDEPMFWRRANQHSPFRPEAGL